LFPQLHDARPEINIGALVPMLNEPGPHEFGWSSGTIILNNGNVLMRTSVIGSTPQTPAVGCASGNLGGAVPGFRVISLASLGRISLKRLSKLALQQDCATHIDRWSSKF